MEPPQQEVMYDLVGFLVWTGGNEVSSARFKTYANAPSGTASASTKARIFNRYAIGHAGQAAPVISVPASQPSRRAHEGCGCVV